MFLPPFFGFWLFLSVCVIVFGASMTLIAFSSSDSGILLLGVIGLITVRKIYRKLNA